MATKPAEKERRQKIRDYESKVRADVTATPKSRKIKGKERRHETREFLKKQGTEVTKKDPRDMSQKELSTYKKKVMKRGVILAAELAVGGTGLGIAGKRAAAKAAKAALNKDVLKGMEEFFKRGGEKKLRHILSRADARGGITKTNVNKIPRLSDIRVKDIDSYKKHEALKRAIEKLSKPAAKRGKDAMSAYKKRTTKKALQKHMELKRAAAKSKTKPSTTKTKRSQAKKSPTVDMRKASPHTKYKEAKSLAKREGHEGTVAGARITARGIKRPTVKATTKAGKALRTKGPGGKTKELTKKQIEIAKKGAKKRIEKKMAADKARKTYKEGIKEAKRTGQTKRDPFKSARAKTKVKGSTPATARKASPLKSTKGQLEQPGGRRRIVDAPWNQKRIKVAKLLKQKKEGTLGSKGKKLLDKLKGRKPKKKPSTKPKKGGPKKKK